MARLLLLEKLLIASRLAQAATIKVLLMAEMSSHGSVARLELQLLGSNEAEVMIVETITTHAILLQVAVLHLGHVIAIAALKTVVEILTMALRMAAIVLQLWQPLLLGNNLLLPAAKVMAPMQAMQLLAMVLILHSKAWVLLPDLEGLPAHLDWLHPLDSVRFCSSLLVALRHHLLLEVLLLRHHQEVRHHHLPQVISHLHHHQELRCCLTNFLTGMAICFTDTGISPSAMMVSIWLPECIFPFHSAGYLCILGLFIVPHKSYFTSH